ncbi:MAG: energy transducer TonB, partial [Pseudomonadota bacterium]
MGNQKRGPNWILGSLFCVSLGVHVMLIGYLNGLFSATKNVTRIEVSINDISKPKERSFPKPRTRIKPPEETKTITKVNVNSLVEKLPEPTNSVPGEYPHLGRVQEINVPEVINAPKPTISAWNPRRLESGTPQTTLNDYLAMVRLRIDRHKTYPQAARMRQLQGTVVVHFVITLEGTVKTLKIIQSSGYTVLDEAGLKAIRD